MIAKIVNGALETLPDYAAGYNTMPKGWEIISANKFWERMMRHVWEYMDFKQVHEDSIAAHYINTRLWMINCWDMTVGIGALYINRDDMKYFQFGPWLAFDTRFVAQFAGDNS
jgi:hypothetical protein